MQKMTAVKIIASVVIASCHKSTKSIEIRAKDEIIANLIPFVLNAKNMNIKITTGNGMKLKSVSKPLRTESIGADNFLKSGRCMNNHSLIFLSIHSAIGM
jgi:flagellar hook assembly protein FlgD